MVIAALGVLDDVTVSQASTVMALRGANPALGFRELSARAMRVGRDHVSATVNTLGLAYVGASLPVLLIFSSAELGLGAAALALREPAERLVRAGARPRPLRAPQPEPRPAARTATPSSPAVIRLSRTGVSQAGWEAATQARIPPAVPTAAAAVAMHWAHIPRDSMTDPRL